MNASCCVFFFLWHYSPNLGHGLPPLNSLLHFGLLNLKHSVGLLGRVISPLQALYLYTNTEKHTQTPNINALSGIWTHDPGFRASEDSACLRPLGYRDRHPVVLAYTNCVFYPHNTHLCCDWQSTQLVQSSVLWTCKVFTCSKCLAASLLFTLHSLRGQLLHSSLVLLLFPLCSPDGLGCPSFEHYSRKD
jgi:hypothetical protein